MHVCEGRYHYCICNLIKELSCHMIASGGHWIVSWADSSYIRYLLYDVLPKVIPKNVFHDDNWMILKYKHGETWDCIGWWFLHWYLIWNIKNGYTELDNFDVYLLTRNQICTHCVRNYSEACTDVLRHQNRWLITEAAPLSIRRYWGEQRANSK